MIEVTNKHQYNVQHPSIVIDEIQNFVEACWISAPEAVGRILEFNINRINPAVTCLQVHLHNQQRINFDKDDNLEEDPDARELLYADFPLHYTWNKATKT
ncbi:14287_t:CDS:2 [Cetraspora pellucida]|uniref:14287_t:CDS:1 n=1 Tax=Cetraspora pellucida TaxID=1433469 RepID=A0A9N8VCR8_9GLOM|nr:14287_t:CDS:2 [Cetraspora pellucida]